jgi:general nucleoside transport system permease protein
LLILIIMSIVGAATPILLAALGELVVEKSGVLNLGVEGMMLIGAVTGFAATVVTGQPAIGVLAAMLAAAGAAALFGFLTLTLTANQVATGLALTIFGIGLSALAVRGLCGAHGGRVRPAVPGRSGQPSGVARDVRLQSACLRVADAGAGGELVPAPDAGRAYPEGGGRIGSVGAFDRLSGDRGALHGGAVRGRHGGALPACFYSLVLTPMWAEELTAGRGWIALALVVFASWRPMQAAAGRLPVWRSDDAGAACQGAGLVAAWRRSCWRRCPIIATIAVLAMISARSAGSVGRAGLPRQAVQAGHLSECAP